MSEDKNGGGFVGFISRLANSISGANLEDPFKAPSSSSMFEGARSWFERLYDTIHGKGSKLSGDFTNIEQETKKEPSGFYTKNDPTRQKGNER